MSEIICEPCEMELTDEDTLGCLICENDSLQSKLDKAVEALDFYSHAGFTCMCCLSTSGYKHGEICKNDTEWCGKNLVGGKKAREALKEIKEGE